MKPWETVSTATLHQGKSTAETDAPGEQHAHTSSIAITTAHPETASIPNQYSTRLLSTRLLSSKLHSKHTNQPNQHCLYP